MGQCKRVFTGRLIVQFNNIIIGSKWIGEYVALRILNENLTH